MSSDFQALEALRQNHPAWRLLASPHAPLMVSFFQKVFLERNARVLDRSDLTEALEDELFHLWELLGQEKFPYLLRALNQLS